MQPGFAFRFGDGHDGDHIWVVISDTNEELVLIVNLTTHRPPRSDSSCLLQPGDHPAIRHETCIAFEWARRVRRADILAGIQNGDLRSETSMSKEVMTRIWDGAQVTRQLKLGYREFLKAQNIIFG